MIKSIKGLSTEFMNMSNGAKATFTFLCLLNIFLAAGLLVRLQPATTPTRGSDVMRAQAVKSEGCSTKFDFDGNCLIDMRDTAIFSAWYNRLNFNDDIYVDIQDVAAMGAQVGVDNRHKVYLPLIVK